MASYEWVSYGFRSRNRLAGDIVSLESVGNNDAAKGFAFACHRCQQGATGNAPSVVSGTAVSTGGRTEWQVVAHEIGHNFGAIVRLFSSRGRLASFLICSIARRQLVF